MTFSTPLSSAHGALIALVLTSCAVPVAPTGGPTDAVPPALLEVEPGDGATNVTTERLRFTFGEYISEATFARAFSITPEPERPPEISWRRRTVTVRLRSPLRDNTTYRLTIDRELRDVNNVQLQTPIVTAFSTGPTINRATMEGTIVDGVTGAGVNGMDVYVYAFEPEVFDTLSALPARPLYRTQTDNRGNFELTYLSAGEYFVLGVADRNTNRIPDSGERTAFPGNPTATASESSPDSLVMYAAMNDTTAPTVRRASATSNARFEVTFSEPVLLTGEQGDSDGWSVSDSVGVADNAQVYPIRKLFVSPTNTDRVVLVTDPVPETTRTVQIVVGTVRDSLGNASARELGGPGVFVSPSRRADTTRTRVLDIRPTPGVGDSVATVSNHERIVVTLNQSAPGPGWIALTGPGSASEIGFVWTTADGRSYQIDPSAPAGTEGFQLRVQAETDSVVTHFFRRLRPGETGEISGVVQSDSIDQASDVIVEVFRSDDSSLLIPAVVNRDGTFMAGGLRPGRYVLRTFLDLDGDGRWTPASFPPYARGEPVHWVTDSLEVRARFETVLPDTLRLPVTLP